MEIGFATAELASTCSSMDSMAVRWGPVVARSVVRRILQLEAAGTFGDVRRLPQVRHHRLRGKPWPRIGIELEEDHRLLIDLTDAVASSGVDEARLDRCRRVEIVGVEGRVLPSAREEAQVRD